jgi:hypothetical protein
VTVPTPLFVPVEVRSINYLGGVASFAACWHRPAVPVIGVEMIVYMPMKVVRAIEPMSAPFAQA